MTASGPSGAEITAACSGVGSGSRSSRASWPVRPADLAGPYLTVVLTLAFQQMPLTFRAGTVARATSFTGGRSGMEAPWNGPSWTRSNGLSTTSCGSASSPARCSGPCCCSTATTRRSSRASSWCGCSSRRRTGRTTTSRPWPRGRTPTRRGWTRSGGSCRCGCPRPGCSSSPSTTRAPPRRGSRCRTTGRWPPSSCPGREIVTTALSLLRANYVFPELAEQAAAAVEARLAAGEYDDLDEITLTELAHPPPAGSLRRQAPGVRLGGGPPDPPPGPGPEPRHRNPDQGAQGSRGQAAGHAADGAAGQLRHPPGRAAGRQRRLPGRAPGGRPGQRGPGHRRGDGTGRRDLRAHHRPAAQRRRLARGRGLLVQLPVRRAADSPQRHLPRRYRRDQAVLGAAVRAGHPLRRPAGLRADQQPTRSPAARTSATRCRRWAGRR